jgi:L-lactate dehydrogenase complex protein LldF
MPGMTRRFRERVRQAIADEDLQIALDANADRRMSAHAQAFEAIGGLPDARSRAAAIRHQTLGQLDATLEDFKQALTSNGMLVHEADDAQAACHIVLDIARSHRARLVVKAKSMVSEEIDLNASLEAAGIQVVETDLGEYIVQLRGEKPAHIITPAIHLRRSQVGQTLADSLGVPYTDDVTEMTHTARLALRQAFLKADLGISGVNFGVAETGTLCLVTNEGNGRLVTTLPPVHIALMGIERLVPSLRDLALMLELLPRSATGQALTSYVSLIQRPRQPGDADGPQERHVVLIDNGRRRLRQSPQAAALLCIRCGACLNACPVYREVGGHAYDSVYPGPIGSVISPALFGSRRYGHLATASSLCGACEDVCPVGVPLTRLLVQTRHEFRSQAPSPSWLTLGLSAYARLAARPRLFRLAQSLAAIGLRALPRHNGWITAAPPPLSAWTRRRHLPPLQLRPCLVEEVEPQKAGGPAAAAFEPASLSGAPAVTHGSPHESLSSQFTQTLHALGGRVIACQPAEFGARLRELILERGWRIGLAWEDIDPWLEEARRAAESAGARLLHLPAGEPVSVEGTDLPRAEFGLTGSLAGLAATGTLAIPGGPGRPGLASLLPRAHLAMLHTGQLHASLQEWLAQGAGPSLSAWSQMALISGPSRTADIEMTLTIGVHGPEEVIVFLIDDSGGGFNS